MKNQVSFCVDVDRSVLINNFEKRGWIHVGPEDKWNFYWTNIQTCRSLFSTEINYTMKDDQMINHFPNHYELGRKDLLMRWVEHHVLFYIIVVVIKDNTMQFIIENGKNCY